MEGVRRPPPQSRQDAGALSAPLRIAVCPPEIQPLIQVLNGASTDATYIIQAYVAEGLRKRGHRLTFVAPNGHGDVVCAADLLRPALARRTWSASYWFDFVSRVAWVTQRALGIPYLNMFSNYRLYDACLQCLPGHDVVYERSSEYRFGVAMACKRLRLPYVLYVEADDILERDYLGKPVTGLLRWRASAALRHNLDAADCVICVSEPARQHLVSAWGVAPHKIVVFPNAADMQRFQPSAETAGRVRASLGMSTNPIILFVGSYFKWHDVATLLRAFGQLRLTCPEARLVLVGDGAQRPEMMRLSLELSIDHAVRFHDAVPHHEVPGWLGAADIAVAPYPPMPHEMWLSPIKVFEYMASGRAIVASAVGQLNSVIRDGQNGLLVPPGDAAAMAAALKRLVQDVSLRTRLGQCAREEAASKYSWEHYVSRLERVYAAALARKPVAEL